MIEHPPAPGQDPARPQAGAGPGEPLRATSRARSRARIPRIAVLLDASQASSRRLALAANLAAAHGAKLVGIGALSDAGSALDAAAPPSPGGFGLIGLPSIPFGGEPGPEVDPGRPSADRLLIDSVEAAFRHAAAAHPGLACEWHLIRHDGLSEMARHAKGADLTVIGRLDPGAGGAGEAGFGPEDLVTASGAPTLIVPCAGLLRTVGRRVLVAWDGSDEVARALTAALPLLHGAQDILLLEVDGPQGRQARHDLSMAHEMLARDGLQPSAGVAGWNRSSAGKAVLGAAADYGADLVVAGSSRHPGLLERLFGGMSDDALAHLTVPVLVSS